MLAGNIKYNDNLRNYKKIANYLDLSDIINLQGNETPQIKNREGRGMFKTGALSLCPRSFLPINSFSKISSSFWRSLLRWYWFWPLWYCQNSLSEELCPEQIYRPYSSLPSLFKAKNSPQRQALRGVFLILSVRYQPGRF